MIAEINAILPEHILQASSSQDLYIVDYKNITGEGVKILTEEPEDAKAVYLSNPSSIEIVFDAFSENALPLSTGVYNRQCECLAFPSSDNDTDWILFVETKYTNDLSAAFREENNYPNTMINQILKTVKYFRDKGIIAANRRVHAIVSFPNLIEEFNSTFFASSGSDPMDILLSHKVLIRATNMARIISHKRIKLLAEF